MHIKKGTHASISFVCVGMAILDPLLLQTWALGLKLFTSEVPDAENVIVHITFFC